MSKSAEIIMSAKVDRIGRAFKGLVSAEYSIEFVPVESEEIRAHITKNNTNTKYAVALDNGKYFCSCKDRFVHGNICKHILMVVFKQLYEAQVSMKGTESK